MASESPPQKHLASVSEADFSSPLTHGTLDVDALIAQVPAGATVKGMFWADLYKLAASYRFSLPPNRYSAFGDYALSDYMRAVARVARNAFPQLPVAEGICRVGERGFEVLASSLAGKVLFAFAGRDLQSTLGLVSQAYRRALDPGDARVALLEPGRAVIELRSIWNYPTSYQVGVFRGAMASFGHQGSVKIRVHSPCDVDYLVQWG